MGEVSTLGPLEQILGEGGTLLKEPHMSVERRFILYEAMLRQRRFDAILMRAQRQGRVGFHLGSEGEEAAILGVAEALRDDDYLVPSYREAAALFHRGFPLEHFLNQSVGNAHDRCLGRQMPVHFCSLDHRCLSVSAPIGTQIPHAAGLAYAAKLRGEAIAVAVFFGDGATSSQGFHEGLTMAAALEAPVVFFCRNNRYAISLPVEEQCRADTLAEKAAGYGIPAYRVDGDDLLAVHHRASLALDAARRERRPIFVELLTYRLGAHSSSDDPSRYRSESPPRDPIQRIRDHLFTLPAFYEDAITRRIEAFDRDLREMLRRAESEPPPPIESILEGVYEAPTRAAKRQLRSILEARRV